jgi:serine kinase of HPr protein (carbohydrate metabolism regulator)
MASHPLILRGSCVSIGGRAVLLRGESGSGKSDLALRLIDGGAALVSDDYVQAERRGDLVWAVAPAQIAGLLEIRGAGVVALDHHEEAALRLIIDLAASEAVIRLPDPAFEPILGVNLPKFALAPFEASTPAKIRLLLHALDTRAFRMDLTAP